MTKNKRKREPRPPISTGLPSTYEEAMIQEAMLLVERIEDKLTSPAREYIKALLRERLRRGLTDRDEVIAAAEVGDDLSHEALMDEFHEKLDEGVMPPASLRDYARRTEKHPKRGKGRVWYDDWRRNWGIMLLVALVGGVAERPCAAGIVAAALKRRGFKRVSESRISNLWGQLGGRTIFGLAACRVWPEIIPYVGGDPANFDLMGTVRPYLK